MSARAHECRARGVPLQLWLGYWRSMQRYFRYEVRGLHHLERGEAALIVGYHGRPVAWDTCLLSVTLYDRLGYLPHGIFHRQFERAPVTGWLLRGLGGVTNDGPRIAEAVARGEHIVTVPGGTREGYRRADVRYRVDWGTRTGYVRLAAKYRLPIVPCGASGVDDTYLGLNDGYRWGKRLGVPGGVPVWLAVGPTGLFPCSLPFPVRIRQVVGPPVRDAASATFDPEDEAACQRVHEQVASRVQSLLATAREWKEEES